MIRLDAIGKQHGNQILFLEASATLQRGEKVGLVGPNGAGKSTLFRLITREEQPDEGQVSIDRGVTIGHFSQDVGEMAGRSMAGEPISTRSPTYRPMFSAKFVPTSMRQLAGWRKPGSAPGFPLSPKPWLDRAVPEGGRRRSS